MTTETLEEEKPDPDTHIVFVYGSLMRGFRNHVLLTDARFIGEGASEPRFTMLHLGSFPALVEVGSTTIVGELYEVDDITLGRLDMLEGHPAFYYRKEIGTVTGEEGAFTALAYLLPKGHLDSRMIIESGNWRAQ
jgi:gamma-glutamylaminecyclotransferase